jgi:hypothetical protein
MPCSHILVHTACQAHCNVTSYDIVPISRRTTLQEVLELGTAMNAFKFEELPDWYEDRELSRYFSGIKFVSCGVSAYPGVRPHTVSVCQISVGAVCK